MQDIFAKLDRLETLLEQAVLAEDPPGGRGLTLTAALEAAGQAPRASDLHSALRAAKAQFKMLQCPIIAVLGELNAGKSSVVGSFLSPAGQARIPRGLEDAKGTHRFVYWLPSSWMQDETTKAAFLDLLTAVHGNQREYLAAGAEQAAEQYRSGQDNRERIRLPLIADDPALDELGAALLDCPDVQTKDQDIATDPGGDVPRLEFLSQAARICSAFLLIWERAKLRDRLLETMLTNIRSRVSGAPMYFLVNKLEPRRDEPAATLNDPTLVRLLDRYHMPADRCYVAFHFRMSADGGNPGWKDLTPPKLVRTFEQTGRQFPQFFAFPAEATDVAEIDESRFLWHLPSQLNMADLQRCKLEDNWRELTNLVGDNLRIVQQWIAARRARAWELHNGLLEFCTRQFTDPKSGEPKQIATKDFTEALQASFVRTAPKMIRWSMAMSHRFETISSKTAKRLRRLLAWTRLKHELQASRERFEKVLAEEGVVGAARLEPEWLAKQMHALRWVPEASDPGEIEQGWQAVLQNFYRFPLEHDPQRLDEMTRDVWNSLNLWQQIKASARGVVLTLGTVAALASLLTAVVDLGATAMATYSLAATLAQAIPGIPIAVAGGAIGGGAALAGLKLGAINLNTLPYLSRFFALACDAFGVPRQLVGKSAVVTFGKSKEQRRFALPEPHLEQQAQVCVLEELQLWRPTPVLDDYYEVLRDA